MIAIQSDDYADQADPFDWMVEVEICVLALREISASLQYNAREKENSILWTEQEGVRKTYCRSPHVLLVRARPQQSSGPRYCKLGIMESNRLDRRLESRRRGLA